MNVQKITKTTKTAAFIERFRRWGIAHSLLPLVYGTSCCFEPISQEVLLEISPAKNYPVEESDLLIIGGSITYKQLPFIKDIYERMPKEKWVMALGVCSLSGGPFQSYSVVKDLNEHIPVDIFVTGCPPTRESLEQGVADLQKMIMNGQGACFDRV